MPFGWPKGFETLCWSGHRQPAAWHPVLLPRWVAVLMGGVMWLISANPGWPDEGRSAFYEGFEGPEVSWQQAGSDAPHRVEYHGRIQGEAHVGQGCERLRIVAGQGSYVYLAHPIGRAPVIDELLVSVWVKSDRAGIQVLAQVVLPRSPNPRTGGPLIALIQGTTYTQVGRWEQLRLQNVPQQLARQVRVLRSQYGPHVDEREAYVSHVLLNVYGGPGVTNVWIDDLDVAGLVSPQASPTPFGASNPPRVSAGPALPNASGTSEGVFPRSTGPSLGVGVHPARPSGDAIGSSVPIALETPRIRLDGPVLRVGHQEFFPRIIPYRGEPLTGLQQMGFNVIWLPTPPGQELLAEVERLHLWLICPPPISTEAPRGQEAVAVGIRERIPSEFNRVLAWDVTLEPPGARMAEIGQWADRVRRADSYSGRPLVVRANENLQPLSRLVDILWLTRPSLGTGLELTDYVGWLRQQELLVRPGTPLWVSVPTQLPPAIRAQWLLVASGGQRLGQVPGPIRASLSPAEGGSGPTVWAAHGRQPIPEHVSPARGAGSALPERNSGSGGQMPENVSQTEGAGPALPHGQPSSGGQVPENFSPAGGTSSALFGWNPGFGRQMPENFSAEQVRLGLYAALAGGARGVAYESDRPLLGPDPESQTRTALLELLNRETQVLEPWLAAGFGLGPLQTSQNQVQGTLFRTERARLALLFWTGPAAQYLVGQASSQQMTFLLPGLPEAHEAYQIAGGRLQPLRRDRTTGGTRIQVEEFDQTAAVLFCQDPLTVSATAQRLQAHQRRQAELHYQLASEKLRQVQELLNRLPTLALLSGPNSAETAGVKPTRPSSENPFWPRSEPSPVEIALRKPLEQAQQQLALCAQRIQNREYPAAEVAAQRADRVVRLLERTVWESVVGGPEAAARWPLARSFRMLPEHLEMVRRVRYSAPGPNLLPAGDFEDLQAMLGSGWQRGQTDGEIVSGFVELARQAARSGQYGLRLSAVPRDNRSPPEALDAPPIWVISPPIPVRPGQCLRIQGWVQVPRLIQGSVDGLIVSDSIGGETLAWRVRNTSGWQKFEMYRMVPQGGTVRLSFILTGLGEVWLDEVQVQPMELIGVVQEK